MKITLPVLSSTGLSDLAWLGHTLLFSHGPIKNCHLQLSKAIRDSVDARDSYIMN